MFQLIPKGGVCGGGKLEADFINFVENWYI